QLSWPVPFTVRRSPLTTFVGNVKVMLEPAAPPCRVVVFALAEFWNTAAPVVLDAVPSVRAFAPVSVAVGAAKLLPVVKLPRLRYRSTCPASVPNLIAAFAVIPRVSAGIPLDPTTSTTSFDELLVTVGSTVN